MGVAGYGYGRDLAAIDMRGPDGQMLTVAEVYFTVYLLSSSLCIRPFLPVLPLVTQSRRLVLCCCSVLRAQKQKKFEEQAAAIAARHGLSQRTASDLIAVAFALVRFGLLAPVDVWRRFGVSLARASLAD